MRGKTAGLTFCCLFFSAFSVLTSEAQISCKYDQATVAINSSAGTVLKPASGAQVWVCPAGSSGVPPTGCSPKSNLVSSAGVPINNPVTVDSNGNYGFCVAAAGKFLIQVGGTGLTTNVANGVVIPGDPSSPTFPNPLVIPGSVTIGGTLGVTGLTTLTGNAVVGPGTPAVAGAIRMAQGQGIFVRNSGNTVDQQLISSSGANGVNIGANSEISTSGTVIINANGAVPRFALPQNPAFNVFGFRSDGALGWSSTTSPSGAGDTMISRAGVNKIQIGVTGTTADASGELALQILEGTRYADQFAGADIFAKTNAALASAGIPCAVKIPSGVYTGITTTLNMKTDCSVDLTGVYATYSGSGVFISFCGVQNAQLFGGVLFGAQNTTSIGIQMGCRTPTGTQTIGNKVWGTRIGGIFSGGTGFGDGVFIDGTNLNTGTYYNQFYGLISDGNLRRGVLCKPALGNQANQNEFYGGQVQLNGLDGILSDGCTGIEFHSVDSENNNLNAAVAVNISTMSRASNVVTVTTATAINCVAGDVIKIIGATDTTFNSAGVSTATCPTASSFTFNQNGANTTSNTGTAQRTGCGWNFPGLNTPGVANGFKIIGGWSEGEGCDVAIGSAAVVSKSTILGLTVNNVAGASGQVNGVGNDFSYGQGSVLADHFGQNQWHISATNVIGNIHLISNDEAVVASGELLNIFNVTRTGTDAGIILMGSAQYPFTLRSQMILNEQSAPPATAGSDVCYGDSTAHALKCSYNNDTFTAVSRTVFENCGTTTTCAKTVAPLPIIVNGGPISLVAGTLTITALPFTSSTSYVCNADDSTGINGIDVVYVSGSSVTFNGTGTDSIRYQCQGT